MTGSPDAFIDRAKAGKPVRDDGGPAFPVKSGMLFYAPEEMKGTVDTLAAKIGAKFEGMSLRQYYKGQALAGLISNVQFAELVKAGETHLSDTVAGICGSMADAMIAEDRRQS